MWKTGEKGYEHEEGKEKEEEEEGSQANTYVQLWFAAGPGHSRFVPYSKSHCSNSWLGIMSS